MEKKIAKTDITYCMNDGCKEKCFRWHGNYIFEDDGLYSFCSFKNGDCSSGEYNKEYIIK